MSNLDTSTSIVRSESSEQRSTSLADPNMNVFQPTVIQHKRNSADGHVAILWDIENCPVPSDVRPEDIAGNIRMALRVHPIIKGVVMMFSAYGDFNAFPRRLREGCQRTGVKLVDVPNGRKDAADKAILVDMFLFALDNPPPSFIMLISGDVDFAPALHILGQRGYTIILVIPSWVGVSSALCNAGTFIWDWTSVARGEGFVPASRTSMPPRGVPIQINEHPDGQIDEEAIVFRGISQSYYNSRDISIVSQSVSECVNTSSMAMPAFPMSLRSQSLPPGLNEASGCPGSSDPIDNMWVQPGDVNGLKAQLMKLLELSGGCLPLTRVPAEYQKHFGRPLYISEYGEFKLVNLFKRMSDTMAIDGKGHKKFVHLKNWKAGSPSVPPAPVPRKDKGKKAQEESMDLIAGGGSSDEFSDEERVVVEEHVGRENQGRTNYGALAGEPDYNLEQFKYELQEILVSYSCHIFLGCFEAIYKQRYKKPLEYQMFGVEKLEDLLDKVGDIVVLHEDPVSKRKFLAAVGS